MEVIRRYTAVTKPGIIRGNVMTAIAGFLFASQGQINFELLLAVTVGVSLVIASACVYNNYLDRSIDKKMVRTQKRALVTGTIATQTALAYATLLGVLGFAALALYTNALTTLLGAVAFVSYVGIYAVAKRRSPAGTLVGSVPGALSLTAGYTAVSGVFDTPALLLFLIMVAWQMPHFYSIAIFRLKDYKAAGLPVLPAVKGIAQTKQQIITYVLIYGVIALLLFTGGYAGYVYAIGMLVLVLRWLQLALTGFKASDDVAWARKMFGFSLVVLLVFSLLISLDAWLP